MATTINLSDPISTVVTKTNTLITEVGDKATLNTTTTTNIVAAINEINTKVVAIDTDAEIGAKVEAFFAGNQLDVGGINADSADFDSATITTLKSTNGIITNATLSQVTVDSASILAGVATLTSATIATLNSTDATIDSARIPTLSSTNANIDSAEFTNISLDGINNISDLKPLQIYNSAGSVILAGYLLSTSNTAGTL